MSETLVISYRGERIPVEEVEEIGGDHDDLYEFQDCLPRDSHGRYYLRQMRSMQMPPNAEDLYSKKMFALRGDRSEDALEMRRLRAWRRQLTKPRTTIKRITEKTALLWLVHQSCGDDETLKARLRAAVTAMFGKEARAL